MNYICLNCKKLLDTASDICPYCNSKGSVSIYLQKPGTENSNIFVCPQCKASYDIEEPGQYQCQCGFLFTISEKKEIPRVTPIVSDAKNNTKKDANGNNATESEQKTPKKANWFRRIIILFAIIAGCIIYAFWGEFCVEAGKTCYNQKQYEDAVTYFEAAAKRDKVEAFYFLGLCYKNGSGVKKDEQQANKFFMQAAEKNHTESLYILADFYKNHNGKKAVEYLLRAADAGNTDAEFEIGSRFIIGYYVTANAQKAETYLLRAAKKGHTKAIYALGRFYLDPAQGKFEEAFKWLQMAADNDIKEAFRFVADCYNYGKGTEKNTAKALEMYLKAAENGDKNVFAKIGSCYLNGDGKEKNYKEAIPWLLKAEKEASVTAEEYYILAKCFLDGNGIEKDSDKGIKFLQKAANSNLSNAIYDLAQSYWSGDIISQDRQKAFDLFLNAADKGNADAQYFIGNCYNRGIFVRENYNEAVKWLKKAAASNHKQAIENLKEADLWKNESIRSR